MKQRRFRRIEILRHFVAESAAAKGDDFSGIIGDGKRDAAAEAVEETIALVARNEARFGENVVFVFAAEVAEKRVAAAGRVPNAEAFDGGGVKTAIFEIGASGFAFGRTGELLDEEGLGFAMHFDKNGALMIFAAFFG